MTEIVKDCCKCQTCHKEKHRRKRKKKNKYIKTPGTDRGNNSRILQMPFSPRMLEPHGFQSRCLHSACREPTSGFSPHSGTRSGVADCSGNPPPLHSSLLVE